MADETKLDRKPSSISQGCYIISLPGGAVIPEPSEVRAMRTTIAHPGADMQFVHWGQARHEAAAATAANEAKVVTENFEPAEF